jgi:uroporphyrinogen decarboxylase
MRATTPAPSISALWPNLLQRRHRTSNVRSAWRPWAIGVSGGVLGPDEFERWCFGPAKGIVAGLRRRIPGAKIIGFPRGAGTSLKAYVEGVAVDAIGLDWMIDRNFVRDEIQRYRPVQGNLDPLALLAGGAALDREVDAILRSFAGRPFIFNLGHGILPETPIAHVERMIARVRGWKPQESMA